MHRFAFFCLCVPFFGGVGSAEPQAILNRRCAGCHNAETKAGNLVLSARPADPARLLERVEKGEMPPGGKLPAGEVDELRRWVAAGAPWDDALVAAPKRAGASWWSLQPLRKRAADDSIDGFVRAALGKRGIAMNAEADRRTLIRRATFDLTGLPPTPEEVNAFLADGAPGAFERLIDRLLESPHYGERWGRHWLDVVRFGESNGYEQNHLRDRAWPYRDWVIRAFNEDMPYSRMVLEQLAGDTVAPGDAAVEAATGFLVAGPHDTVKIQNIDGEKQKRANDLDDIVIASGAGFLGLTIGCARCHDHKFDPIRQADYYRLAAVFDGVNHGEREVASAAERAAREAALRPLRERLEGVKARIAALAEEAEPEIEGRRAELTAGLRPAVDSKLTAETFAAREARFVRLAITGVWRRSTPALDEVEVFAGGRNVALGKKASARVSRTTMDDAKAFYGPELLTDGKFDRHWISGEGNAGEITIDLGGLERVDRVQWSRDRNGAFQGRFLSQVVTGYRVEVSVDGARWERVADSEDRLPYGEAEQRDFLIGMVRPEYRKLLEDRSRLEREMARVPKLPAYYSGIFAEPEEPMRLHTRGNPMTPGAVMKPGSPSTLDRLLPAFELEASAPEAVRRRAFAEWITDDRNALAARVLANRVWHYHFGRGMVGTPSDFGYNGERPTHPELLDYLASRLVENGWRLKALHREIMLSAAWRQSSANQPAAAEADTDARLLWRYPPRRLDAEALRDAVLAVSGKLDLKMGGAGFRLYRYTVDNVATYYPLDEPGPETYRRAVYHQWARSVKDDMLSVHDCPDSALPEPKRTTTTTALQALSLLNAPFLIDQSRYFAERLRAEAADRAGQVDLAWRLAYGREATAEERAEAATFIERNSLELFARVIFNSSEFAYVH
ncbi:MAG: DUF1553 domain-containing protein [Bryobacteraceae bacterium]